MEFKYINYGYIDNKRGKASDICIREECEWQKTKTQNGKNPGVMSI